MKNTYSITDLQQFIVAAKSKTYGDQDFIGQEVVYFNSEPIWAMNYYGYILDTKLISSQEAGKMIMNSLTKMYAEGRFLYAASGGGYCGLIVTAFNVLHKQTTARTQGPSCYSFNVMQPLLA